VPARKREGDPDRHEMQELQSDAGDLDLPRQFGQKIDTLGARAHDHDQCFFKKEAHRKRRDEQRLRIGSPERSESGAFGDQREDNRRERGRKDGEHG
jgi:hypothetical protein